MIKYNISIEINLAEKPEGFITQIFLDVIFLCRPSISKIFKVQAAS